MDTAETAEVTDPPLPQVKARKKKGCRTKVFAGCGVIVVFGLGVISGIIFTGGTIGWLSSRIDGWKSTESKEFITNHIANQLKLTDEQREKIDPIIIQALSDRWELRRDYLKASDTMMADQVVPDIASHLTPEQIEKLDSMFKRWRRDNLMKLEPNPAEDQ